MIDYLAPRSRPSNLDSYGNVRLLLTAVKKALPRFRGDLLDVGCGGMPYKSLICASNRAVTRYRGMDLAIDDKYAQPDIAWDGNTIPLADSSVDCALMTEVLEHCPDPQRVLSEISRVLRPQGTLFFTVPFIWPMHETPYDEFRYTIYSLSRFLSNAGFRNVQIEATGGRHAFLAVVLGLWVRRRTLTSRVDVMVRHILSFILWPIILMLLALDRPPDELGESTLVVGFSVLAEKASTPESKP